MSYLCSTNKKYCVSLWEFYVVGPQSGRDDVRPRGDEQPADCVGRRPSMCFVGDTLFTAVLIPMLGGYLLVDDTLASWANMLLLRRNWYISWADDISGGTSRLDGDTFGWTIHIYYTLVGWCYFLPGRYTPWLALHLRVIHIFLRLPGRYTTWSALHFIHWSFSYLGDTYLLLLTWAIHTLVGATFEGDTHLLTITWAIGETGDNCNSFWKFGCNCFLIVRRISKWPYFERVICLL